MIHFICVLTQKKRRVEPSKVLFVQCCINVYTVNGKSLNTPIYLEKKIHHRLNTLPQSPDMTSREYLGDHLKERL